MKRLSWIAMITFGFAANTFAEVIVTWENDHLSGNQASTTAGEAPSAGFWHSDLAAAPVLSRGPGGVGVQYTNTFGMRNANSQSLSDAIASNRYVTFSLAAQSGKAMNLTNIFIRLQAQNATSYEVSFALMSDATGFEVGDELTIWTVGGTGNSSDWLGQVRTLDLSGVADLQNISEVEFRIYAYGQQGGEFTQVGIGRAFQVNGTPDLRISGEFIDGGGPVNPEIALLSIQAGPGQAVVTWSEPPAGYETAVWWMPYLDAALIDQVVLITGIPSSQTSYADTVQHTEEQGYYRVESIPETND